MKPIKIKKDKLRKAIKNYGITQIDLCKEISITPVALCKILKVGKTSDITLNKIVNILNQPEIIKIDDDRYFKKALNKPYSYYEFIKD